MVYAYTYVWFNLIERKSDAYLYAHTPTFCLVSYLCIGDCAGNLYSKYNPGVYFVLHLCVLTEPHALT